MRLRRRAIRGIAMVLVLMCAAARHAHGSCAPPVVLFLEFDGGLIEGNPMCEDAFRNCSSIVGRNLGVTRIYYPPFSGTPAQRRQILSLVRSFFRPFNVVLPESRPSSGRYTVVLIGGYPESVGDRGQAASGVAPVDCGNDNDANIAFVYANTLGNDPSRVAKTAAQEAAHTLGLSHVEEPRDIMYQGPVEGTPSFRDETMRVSTVNTTDCTDDGFQNDVTVLRATVGAACQDPGGTGCSVASRGSPDGLLMIGTGLVVGAAMRRRRRVALNRARA